MSEGEGGGRIRLGRNNYGKSDVRLVKVFRKTRRHEVTDLRVDVALEGDFDAAHTRGDNAGLLATDTMRNTVYALAKDHLGRSIEEFGLKLVGHFLEAGPTVERARVSFTQQLWERIVADGRGHDHSFVRAAGERTATVAGDTGGAQTVEAGISDLLVLKSTCSGWEGFLREEYTSLPETDDRILSTIITASWAYNTRELDYGSTWTGVKNQVLTTFTDHYSPSMQNTLYRMGEAVLEGFPEVESIRFSCPNRHHLLYDLGRFGMENEGEIFHASAEPYGLIEGTVERS